MLTARPKILAIDPGTKEIGFAVLSGVDLCYYGVKTIKHRQPPQVLLAEITRQIDALIEDHRPEVLAIERTFLVHKSAALLNVAAAEIKRAARQRGLIVYERAPVSVRTTICRDGAGTKRETARRVAELFPELARLLKQPTKWEEIYWSHLFDAVAIGWVCLQEMYGGAAGESAESL